MEPEGGVGLEGEPDIAMSGSIGGSIGGTSENVAIVGHVFDISWPFINLLGMLGVAPPGLGGVEEDLPLPVCQVLAGGSAVATTGN